MSNARVFAIPFLVGLNSYGLLLGLFLSGTVGLAIWLTWRLYGYLR